MQASSHPSHRSHLLPYKHPRNRRPGLAGHLQNNQQTWLLHPTKHRCCLSSNNFSGLFDQLLVISSTGILKGFAGLYDPIDTGTLALTQELNSSQLMRINPSLAVLQRATSLRCIRTCKHSSCCTSTVLSIWGYTSYRARS